MDRNLIIALILSANICVAQNAEIIKFDKLESQIQDKSKQIRIFNFWATWCAPCVKELPFFESLEAKHDPNIAVTLINLDFADDVDKVNSFISRKKIHAQVRLLDEIDYNSWIDKVDSSWSGAIPATLIINTATGQRKFVDKEIKEGDLQKYIDAVRN